MAPSWNFRFRLNAFQLEAQRPMKIKSQKITRKTGTKDINETNNPDVPLHDRDQTAWQWQSKSVCGYLVNAEGLLEKDLMIYSSCICYCGGVHCFRSFWVAFNPELAGIFSRSFFVVLTHRLGHNRPIQVWCCTHRLIRIRLTRI